MVVLQLADVFQNFVEKSILMYGINPLYSYSAPGYDWKAGLMLTILKLDFIKDEELLLLLEKIAVEEFQVLWVIVEFHRMSTNIS